MERKLVFTVVDGSTKGVGRAAMDGLQAAEFGEDFGSFLLLARAMVVTTNQVRSKLESKELDLHR